MGTSLTILGNCEIYWRVCVPNFSVVDFRVFVNLKFQNFYCLKVRHFNFMKFQICKFRNFEKWAPGNMKISVKQPSKYWI